MQKGAPFRICDMRIGSACASADDCVKALWLPILVLMPACAARRWYCPGGAEEFSPGFQPWETSNKAVRPHKEHGGITRYVGGGNWALSWL
jgi:hypothetical protein